MWAKYMRLEKHKNTSHDYKKAKKLRNEASPIERKLWGVLKEYAKVKVLKFRRQHPVHPYVVDFACMAARVLIEIDGDSHDGREAYDQKREAFLCHEGYKVLRFSNQDVLKNVESVVMTILAKTEERLALSQSQLADVTERVIEALRVVYDPEIPVNVYDLGLIYKIDLTPAAGDKMDAAIEMSLTTANCPMADMIPGMVYDAVRDRIPDLNEIKVSLVWDPPWDPSRMSDDARAIMDFY